ncbi:MAG: sigma-70 family RNA polymerase sigma factor, partial [Puniceicoccales bacterium]|nr:sigma-70 family RNA polymerase sigma factor [Puniceicoccales bacterium]
MNPPDTSFSAFMRKYQDMVFTTSTRIINNDAEAEDIAQEVFLKAYAHYDSLRDNPAAPRWLRTVTTNLSINHLQRYRKRWRFFSEFIRRKDKDDAG